MIYKDQIDLLYIKNNLYYLLYNHDSTILTKTIKYLNTFTTNKMLRQLGISQYITKDEYYKNYERYILNAIEFSNPLNNKELISLIQSLSYASQTLFAIDMFHL